MRYLETQYSPTMDSNHIFSAEERVWRKAKWEEQRKKYNAVLSEQRECFTKKFFSQHE